MRSTPIRSPGAWLPHRLYETFMNIKRMEAARFSRATPHEVAQAYRDLY